MSFTIPDLELLDPRILISINALGFLIACFVMAMRCNMKKQAGLGPVMTVVLVALMVGMGCWAMQVAKISFMPLCISLTTALLLPELWHSLKDFSYFSSAKVAAFILALSALSGLTVIPLWKDRSEVNLIPAVVMIILVAAATSGFSLLVGMADWINKKAKT